VTRGGAYNLILLLFVVTGLVTGVPSLQSTWSAAAEWGLQAEVDVLLGVNSDKEAWHVDDLLADSDVSLLDEDASVVNALGQTELEDQSLQTPLQDVLGGQGKDVIELGLTLLEEPESIHTSHQGVCVENSLWVVLWKSEQLSSGLSQLGENQLNSPELSLVTKTVLPDDLHLRVQALLLERTPWLLEGLAICEKRKTEKKNCFGLAKVLPKQKRNAACFTGYARKRSPTPESEGKRRSPASLSPLPACLRLASPQLHSEESDHKKKARERA